MAFTKQKLIQASAHSSFTGTLLSRVSGLIRDVLMAFVFGSSPQIAALMVAFRFSNLLRRLFGEGALHAAFVPAFEKIRQDSEEKAAIFFKDLSWMISFILLAIIVIVEFTLGGCLSFLSLSQGDFQIVVLTMVLLPTLLFVCNTAFSSSLMQCLGSYFVPAASSVVFNLFWILGVLCVYKTPMNQAVFYLSFWMAVGLFLQWCLMLPTVISFLKKQLKNFLLIDRKSLGQSFSVIAKPLGLGILGVSTTQVNSALDGLFARYTSLEGPAYLWYAIRIEQVPLALFGVAMAGAILPPLFRSFRRNKEEYVELLDYSLAQACGFLVPCTFALIWIGPACVNLLYNRGHFDVVAAHQTTYSLWAYSFGLVPQGLVLILAPAFYVQNQYTRTTRASFIAMILNIGLNCYFALILKMPSYSVALATSICSWIHLLILWKDLSRSVSIGKLRLFLSSIPKVLGVTLLASFAGYLISASISGSAHLLVFPRKIYLQLGLFCIEGLAYSASLFVVAYLLKVKEVLSIFSYIPFVNLED